MATTMHCAPNSSAISRYELGSCDRRGVDRDLVGAGAEQAAGVVDVRMPPPTVNGMNTSSAVRRDDVDHRVALVGRRGDVEEDELVGALGVVARRELDRIAGVAQVDEVDALDDAAPVDVEARDDPHGAHACTASSTVNRPS